MRNLPGYLSLLLLVLLACRPAAAQPENSNWFFGTNAALHFPATGPPAPLTGSAMFASEGCVSVSDAAGQLLFYSNGETIWNRTHQPMANGSSLGGSRSATQGVAAVQNPANPQQYYLFTADAAENKLAGGLQYNVLDMSRQGGLGEVITRKVVLPIGPVTERITTVRHPNGLDTWVLVHGWGSNTFYAYLLTANGLRAPVASSVGVAHALATNGHYSSYDDAVGYLRASPDGTRLAVALYDRDTELFDFNPGTGQVSNYVPLPGATNGYGVGFSPGGRLLYLARDHGTAYIMADLYQYDLEAGAGAAIAASRVWLATTPAGGGAIQAGPDGRLYLSVDRQQYLGVIASPDVRGTGCAYQPDGAYLGGKLAVVGLPNQLATQAASPVTFAVLAACAGSAVAFAASNPVIAGAALRWDFGDPASGAANAGSGPAPTHAYAQPGTYLVTLTATHPALAAPATYTRPVTVYALPAPRLPADTLACPPVVLRVRGSWPAGTTFRWSDGSLGSTYAAAAPGTYTVQATTPQGCAGSASTRVQLAPVPTVRLGADTAVCASARWLLGVGPQPPGTTYRWPDGSTAPTYLAHGPGTYSVQVEVPGGCLATATRTARDAGCQVVIPNIITPNGDQHNDAWVLTGLAVTDFRLTIFNRWGRLVHEQASYDNRWQAAGLAAGTYYYLLQNPHTGQRYRGWVEVIRPD